MLRPALSELPEQQCSLAVHINQKVEILSAGEPVNPMKLQQLAGDAQIRFKKIWRYLCWHVNMRTRKTITISTKQGVFTILLATHDFVGKSLFCDGEFELDLMSNAMAFLRSIQKCPPKGKGTIVDVGAHNGVTSIGMLCTGELERAIAIEPDPGNFSLLQRNVNQNGMQDRVISLNYAASNEKGEINFELSKNNSGDHRVRTKSRSSNAHATELYHESRRRVITVQAEQLDTMLVSLPSAFTQDIALIWIDVQGFEGYAFQGAQSLLSTGIPVVSEIWPYGLERAGMSKEQFCSIASGVWKHYWVLRGGEFVRRPLDTLDDLIDDLGYDRNHTNIIFTQ